MTNLGEDLIGAFQKGNFLKVVYDNSLGDKGNRGNLTEELVSMHNAGLLDVIAGFRALQNKPDAGIDFFLTRYVLEEVLPHIKSPVQPVMDCVLHLVNEAGQDMAAGTLFAPFIEFCAADPSRPKESLKQIETSIDQFADLLTPTIVAGSRIDTEHYLNEAVRLTEHENIEIRKRAIFSLGKIQYPQGSNLCKPALACLEYSISKETDDQLLGNLIKSAFSLYKHDKSQLERILKLINCALSTGGDYSLHAASELFGFDFNELPEALLDSLLNHLLRVRPKNKKTIDNIDYGLVKLIKREDPTKGIEFLEALLIANPNVVSLDIFDSVISAISKNNRNVLNKLLTRWFLRGDRVLCEGIDTVINTAHDHNILLEVDQSELVSTDPVHIVFLARKTIGYLFLKPVTAASVIISLMHHTNDDETLQQLAALCFDPLLLNFPGKVKDYLIQQAEKESGVAKTTIETALKTFEKYLYDLKSTGVIPELHPSQAHRDAYRRRFSRLMSESLKEAEKKSVFLHFVSKSVLLYGRKSIDYVYGPDGQSNRMETPLHSHITEMEIPRMENIDSFGLDYMLRVFRVEKIRV
jgi:hypothetical protein